MRYTSVLGVSEWSPGGALARLGTLLLFVLLTGPPAFADVPKILKVSEIQAGTEAIGFSVFKGVEPQPFNVVLLEPVDRMGSYLILIRISGGPMDTPLERIGAVSGVSGSPIFVGCSTYKECVQGGTLVGALSYSIGVFIEGGANAAATPAEYMLGARFGGYAATEGLSRRSFRRITDTSGWQNLILASGLDGRAMEQLPRCAEFSDSDIKAGSMITVFLAKGTKNIGVSGTVTWRDGDSIYAFGHPFTGGGRVNFPFSLVSVADTLQTPVGASKISGCELPAHGALLMDGAYEVAGTVGQEVQMVPFDVHLFASGWQAALEQEIVYDSPFTTAIIRLLPATWASQLVGDISDVSVAFQSRMVIENQPEMFWKNVLPAGVFQAPFAEVFNRADNALQTIRASGFPHRLESVHIDISLTNLRVWKKKEAFLSKPKALPGETVHIQIVLEDADSGEFRHLSVPVKVPNDFSARVDPSDPASVGPSVISVLVQDGSHFVDPNDEAAREPVMLEAIIRDINKKMSPPANVLFVRQNLPRTKEGREQNTSAAQSTELSVGKWRSMEAGELEQFPSSQRFQVVVERTAVLDDYIDFTASFTINVDVYGKSAKPQPEQKKGRKWYFLYIF